MESLFDPFLQLLPFYQEQKGFYAISITLKSRISPPKIEGICKVFYLIIIFDESQYV